MLNPATSEPSPEILREYDNIPHLSEQLLVDLVNGLEVSGDILRFRSTQTAFSRVLGLFDGSTQRADNMLAQQSHRSVEALTQWAIELSAHGRHTQEALTLVTQRLGETQGAVQKLTTLGLSHHQKLKEHQALLGQLAAKLEHETTTIKQYIAVIREEQLADQRIDEVMAAWDAGRVYQGYPSLLQAAFALDDLSRGTIGHFIFMTPRFRQLVFDRTMAILRRDFNILPNDYMPVESWLQQSAWTSSLEKANIVAYLVGARSEGYLHRLVRDAVMNQQAPDWLGTEQAEGMPVFFRPQALLETYVNEVQPPVKVRALTGGRHV